MKKLFMAFLLMFVALAYGTVSGAGLLCGSAYAADTMPDGGDSDDSGNGGPDDTSDDGGCGGGGSDGGGADPDGSGGGTDF
ncbi:MAG: hypothetical protein CVU79_03105 [Elusimicrobia bacterium HGW-Elusimicrobia-3]|jgi:hypothetical protein|nr:MAG: hypothetical protein CVU79_03105 [Elusimicrobia bacterium HGW-Elusimicrobia-3]